jgi:hypothetical protein
MIGLALVTFIAIFGQGIRSSFEDAVNKLFVADYALTSTSTFNPIEARPARRSWASRASRTSRRFAQARRATSAATTT